MNRTINYKYKEQIFKVNVENVGMKMFSDSTPPGYAISVNGVLCSYGTEKEMLNDIDFCLVQGIKRYLAEKEIGIIK